MYVIIFFQIYYFKIIYTSLLYNIYAIQFNNLKIVHAVFNNIILLLHYRLFVLKFRTGNNIITYRHVLIFVQRVNQQSKHII